MIDAPISCVRMRDLVRLGRYQGWDPRAAGLPAPCASRAESLTDATGIAESLGPRPRAASSRSGAGDLVASIIW
jgi:hypothetical protein